MNAIQKIQEAILAAASKELEAIRERFTFLIFEQWGTGGEVEDVGVRAEINSRPDGIEIQGDLSILCNLVIFCNDDSCWFIDAAKALELMEAHSDDTEALLDALYDAAN